MQNHTFYAKRDFLWKNQSEWKNLWFEQCYCKRKRMLRFEQSYNKWFYNKWFQVGRWQFMELFKSRPECTIYFRFYTAEKAIWTFSIKTHWPGKKKKKKKKRDFKAKRKIALQNMQLHKIPTPTYFTPYNKYRLMWLMCYSYTSSFKVHGPFLFLFVCFFFLERQKFDTVPK